MTQKHFLENYDDYKVLDFPKMVVLATTYVCNALCPGCAFTNSDIRESYDDTKFMQEDTFKKIADEVGKEKAWLRLSGGGEPLIHPKILDMVKYAKDKDCKVGLINNGSMMTEDIASILLDLEIDMIEFSVDAADAQTYDIVRKGLSFEKLLKNVKTTFDLRNKKKSKTKILASAVNQKGVDIDAVEEFWLPHVDLFQKRKFLTWGINDLEQSADTTPYLPVEDRIPCPIIFDRLLIDSRGRAMFCIHDIAGKTDMGNIHDQSIKSIWSSEDFNKIRQAHLNCKGDQIDICKNCEDWQFRSWNHNYFKMAKEAESNRIKNSE